MAVRPFHTPNETKWQWESQPELQVVMRIELSLAVRCGLLFFDTRGRAPDGAVCLIPHGGAPRNAKSIW